MKPLKFDEVRHILPSLDELRPVFDLLLATSTPDPEHRWSGSGELDTEGARLVEGTAVLDGAAGLVEGARRHTAALYASVAKAVQALSEGDAAAAAAALLDGAALEEHAGRPDRTRAYAEAA